MVNGNLIIQVKINACLRKRRYYIMAFCRVFMYKWVMCGGVIGLILLWINEAEAIRQSNKQDLSNTLLLIFSLVNYDWARYIFYDVIIIHELLGVSLIYFNCHLFLKKLIVFNVKKSCPPPNFTFIGNQAEIMQSPS